MASDAAALRAVFIGFGGALMVHILREWLSDHLYDMANRTIAPLDLAASLAHDAVESGWASALLVAVAFLGLYRLARRRLLLR